MKQYSSACDQNKYVILDVLTHEFAKSANILEVGSGTGQHAVFFAKQLPHLNWQSSDQVENLASIHAYTDEAKLSNLRPAIELDVTQIWPKQQFDGVFSANTTHIMSWAMVVDFFTGVAQCLSPKGRFVLYGPFNYNGCYTSQSNEQFDAWLKAQNPQSAIRDFEALDKLAQSLGLSLDQDYQMPANNHILVWQKS